MKTVLKTILSLLILTSCNYNKEQNEILNNIKNSKTEVFSENYKNKIIQSFTKDDIIELSSNENSHISLYFYQILVKKYPLEAYEIFLKNIDNLNKQVVSTSYDTLEEMTVAEAMLFYATLSNNIFTQKQLDEVFDKIVLDLNNKRHLISYLSMYLDKNKTKPNPKYYSIIKKEILDASTKTYFYNSSLINYFSSYNKTEDIPLIKNYIEKSIYKEPTYFNSGLEFIENSPKDQYFIILENYYDKKIKNYKFRADDIYFELELYIKALTKYKSNKANELLTKIATKSNYFSRGNFLAPKEQLYILLEKEDKSNYFSEIKKYLSNNVSKTKLDSIKNWNERWN